MPVGASHIFAAMSSSHEVSSEALPARWDALALPMCRDGAVEARFTCCAQFLRTPPTLVSILELLLLLFAGTTLLVLQLLGL